MDIITLVGSLRKNSYNMQVVQTMRDRYRDKMTMTIADIGSLPHFNQDDELNPPEVVNHFKQSVLGADGVIIVTPEYNWSVPGVLKNALDWTSRGEQVFIGKPTMTLGATLGIVGTLRAQQHLREMLVAPGIQAQLLPPGKNEILINLVHKKIDEESGQLIDENTLTFLDEKIDAFIKHIKNCH